MSDIALQPIAKPLGGSVRFDLTVNAADLAVDDGLYTAIVVSLFTDRRAGDDDVLPDGSMDKRGWWADAWPDVEQDRIGSRLWLLHREKQLGSVVLRAKEYAEEALQWLIEDGVAAQVEVHAEIIAPGLLGLLATIYKPDGRAIEKRFEYIWRNV